MTTPAKQTPLPWRPYNASGSRIFKTWRIRGDADDSVIAMIPDDSRHSPETMYANAQYIVQACNAFPALYAALEGLLLNAPQPDKDIRKSYSYRVSIEAARAALSLAREEKGGEVK